MPTYTGINDNYLVSSTPWPLTESRNREWYDPYLYDSYVRNAFFYNLVKYAVNMQEVHATSARFSQRIRPHVQAEPLDFRGLDLPRQYFDSKNFTVNFSAYGNSVQYHKWDEMVFQFARKAQQNPSILNTGFPRMPELQQIVREDLANNVIETFDRIARNTILGSGALNRSFASDATGFHDLAAGDVFSVDTAETMRLSAAYNGNASGIIPALVSPAAVRTITSLANTDEYAARRLALQDNSILNFAIGEYMGVTWAPMADLVLYNVGEVLASASITGGIEPGDGAPDPTTTAVDDFYYVGAANATHYIQLSNITDPGTAETGFKVGDIVTLCRTRNAANGAMATANGVDWDDYRNLDMRVVSVDYDNNRIALEEPVLSEHYSTAISTGLYGWVIKARPVHCAVFFNNGFQDPGVAAIVMEPPRMYVTPPQDSRHARWEFGWDSYMGYRVVNPDSISVHFYAGPIVRKSVTGGTQVVNL